MRTHTLIASTLFGLVLVGCAGTPTVFNKNEQRSLQAIALFSSNGNPQFSTYMACTSDDQSCTTVNKVFSEWSNDRDVTLHLVDDDDSFFKDAARASNGETGKPYRLGFKIHPHITPSTFTWYGGTSSLGGSTPPRVGYKAEIYIYDTHGVLLREIPVHRELTAKQHDLANGYIQSEMDLLLSSIDPRYRGRQGRN
jgi:hypothetical protein